MRCQCTDGSSHQLRAQATQRLRKNAAYFRINYLILMLCVTFITLLMNPTSLLVLGFLTAGWSYLFVVRTAPIVIGGRTFRCGELCFI